MRLIIRHPHSFSLGNLQWQCLWMVYQREPHKEKQTPHRSLSVFYRNSIIAVRCALCEPLHVFLGNSPSPFLKMMPTISPWTHGFLYIIHRGFILESMNLHLSALQPGRKNHLKHTHTCATYHSAFEYIHGVLFFPSCSVLWYFCQALTISQSRWCWGSVVTAGRTEPLSKTPVWCTASGLLLSSFVSQTLQSHWEPSFCSALHSVREKLKPWLEQNKPLSVHGEHIQECEYLFG